jgi:hypothetical protein
MDLKIVNGSDGRSGGVVLFWKKEINVQLLFSAPKYIDVKVVESPGKIWRLTGIYGEPRWQDKWKSWDKLRELKMSIISPGLCSVNSMKSFILMRRREAIVDRNRICKPFGMLSLTVTLLIWVSQGIPLLGEEGELERGWIGQFQMAIGR